MVGLSLVHQSNKELAAILNSTVFLKFFSLTVCLILISWVTQNKGSLSSLTFLHYLKTVLMSLLYFLLFSLKVFIFCCFYFVCKIVTFLVILLWAYCGFQSTRELWSSIIGSHCVGSSFWNGIWKDSWRCLSTCLRCWIGAFPTESRTTISLCFLLRADGWVEIEIFLLEWTLKSYNIFIIFRSLVFLIIIGK